MAQPTSSSSAPPGAAWDAALREVAGRPGLSDRLAHPASDLLLRFGESYARLAALPRAQRRRLQRTLKLGLAGVALLLALGLAPQTALAGTIIVDSGGACTLADAIIAANTDAAAGNCPAGSGADIIELQTNVGLTAALPALASEITIEGNGHTIRATAATAQFRVLEVTSSGNLTLQAGHHQRWQGKRLGIGYAGGGVLNDGRLTVQNSTISGNSATYSDGGGIANLGTVTVQNSTLTDNSATYSEGGGIYNTGTLTVQNSTISGNTAHWLEFPYGIGGGVRGIYNTGTLTVQNSTLFGNWARNGGGGIDNSGTLTVQNSILFGNVAYSCGGIGNGGTLTVQNSTLSGNRADRRGGGICNGGTLTVQNSTLSGNEASGGGTSTTIISGPAVASTTAAR